MDGVSINHRKPYKVQKRPKFRIEKSLDLRRNSEITTVTNPTDEINSAIAISGKSSLNESMVFIHCEKIIQIKIKVRERFCKYYKDIL
jgi:hypothetical protein